jgi:DnaJ-class molecular chaperone
MADDPYAVLGVPRGASEEDIRRAFRRLAKEFHPDVNPGNISAAEKFKKVTAAYDIIGDAEKRGQYDRGEIDATGEPRRTYSRSYAGAGARGRPGAGPVPDDLGLGDIFSDIFGSGRGSRGGMRGGFAHRGHDLRYTLEIDFLEAVTGTKKRVTLPEGGVLDLAVPEGVSDGQVLRLRGKGGPGALGAEPGDALIEIKVRSHPTFKRVGDDIILECPVTIDEAILGGKIEVPTVTGRVQLTIPKGTSSGQVFRLKGKGVYNVTTANTGDELVSIRIVMPEVIDDSLSYFFSEWRQKHKYDPRRS